MPRRLLLRLLAAAPATDHVPDAELLRRFAASNDAAAFELIVRRHADAVWAACRRLLRSDADAEDAFQATFLVLLRKARDVRAPCAGGWLHRVAVNAALKLRERNARTATAEPDRLAAIPAPPANPPDAELAAAVHEELARLPDRERLPVVLCDLEGLTHEAAAAALGWPVGTVSGRLSRARAKLRARLERRGLAPAGAVFPALGVPPQLIPKALNLTAGAPPPAVVTLTEGVLSAMNTANLKLAAGVLAGLVALAGWGAVPALTPRPAPDQPPAKAEVEGAADDRPKVDRKWQVRPFPSAYPDIPPLGTKFLDEFEKANLEPIYESDPPLRKLQKARLRVSLERMRDWTDLIERLARQEKGGHGAPGRGGAAEQALDLITKESRAAVALAAEADPAPGARRPWLVLRVATEKLSEEANVKLIRRRADDADRIEAEIELAKHDRAK